MVNHNKVKAIVSKIEGFLSPTIATSTVNIRTDFAPWFDVASAFNNLGMRVLPAVNADQTSNQQLVAATLYGRTLTSFQAAYILTECGMLADARTVVRAAAETVIVLCAVVKNLAVCDSLIDRHFWHHRKLRNAWLNDPQAVAEMTPQEVDAVKATIVDADTRRPQAKELKNDPVSIAVLAEKAGVIVLYNAVYRSTSGDAAHTLIDAMNRHVRADAQGNIQGLRFGPEVRDLPATLSDAMAVLGYALSAVIELFPLSKFGDDLAKCIASRKALGVPGEYRPDSRTAGATTRPARCSISSDPSSARSS